MKLAALVLGLTCFLGGCASHSDHTKGVRTALDAGRPQKALGVINEALEVSSEKDLPDDLGGDQPIWLLDRAMVLQSLDRYELSSRDLETADKRIEVLDLSRNAAHDIGKYLWSDDTGPYKAPAYEKLLINSVNMVNYLTRGDLNGARVEARRLAVMQDYFKGNDAPGKNLMGPGSYLAGFTFEKTDKVDEALRYYDEALAYREYPSLSEPLRRLLSRGSYSTPRLQRAAQAESEAAPAAGSETDAEILVIVSYGRVPPKIAKRVPIGLALTYASGALSPTDRAQANRLAAQGLVTWINYPELGRARGQYEVPSFSLDGRPQDLEGAIAIDQEARAAWEDAKGTVVAAAITRMITRIVAGQVARKATKDSALGTLLSLGVQATMVAADTPDTRSWGTLPARMAFGRVRVRPGAHTVDLVAGGLRKRQKITLEPGGWAVVSHTVLR